MNLTKRKRLSKYMLLSALLALAGVATIGWYQKAKQVISCEKAIPKVIIGIQREIQIPIDFKVITMRVRETAPLQWDVHNGSPTKKVFLRYVKTEKTDSVVIVTMKEKRSASPHRPEKIVKMHALILGHRAVIERDLSDGKGNNIVTLLAETLYKVRKDAQLTNAKWKEQLRGSMRAQLGKPSKNIATVKHALAIVMIISGSLAITSIATAQWYITATTGKHGVALRILLSKQPNESLLAIRDRIRQQEKEEEERAKAVAHRKQEKEKRAKTKALEAETRKTEIGISNLPLKTKRQELTTTAPTKRYPTQRSKKRARRPMRSENGKRSQKENEEKLASKTPTAFIRNERDMYNELHLNLNGANANIPMIKTIILSIKDFTGASYTQERHLRANTARKMPSLGMKFNSEEFGKAFKWLQDHRVIIGHAKSNPTCSLNINENSASPEGNKVIAEIKRWRYWLDKNTQ
jgi:hypothetical protein